MWLPIHDVVQARKFLKISRFSVDITTLNNLGCDIGMCDVNKNLDGGVGCR